MPHLPMTYQFGLFSATQRGKTAGMPQWPELPEETRQALTVLIVRLFVDHARCEPAQFRMETNILISVV